MATKTAVSERPGIVELRGERDRLRARLEEVQNDKELAGLREQLTATRTKLRHEREVDVDPFDDVDDPSFDAVTSDEALLLRRIADRQHRLDRVETATLRALQENARALADVAGGELRARTAETARRVHEHVLRALDEFDELAPLLEAASGDLGIYATDARGPYVLLRRALLEAAGWSTPDAQNYSAVSSFTSRRYGVGATP